MAELSLADFDYELPPAAIAQAPPAARDGGRLLVIERASGALHHAGVADLPDWLRPGDLLVRNSTRVVPARLRGRKATGGAAQALLLGPAGEAGRFRALVRARGRLRPGQKFCFERAGESCDAELVELDEQGCALLAFEPGRDPYACGETPLPPYIRRAPEAHDALRYQTLFARVPGSVAAPTAGLHLSERGLAQLAARGVECADVVLHVGPGTFRPLREADLRRGRLHPEPFELPAATAERVAAARARGGRVVALGTTSARVLEACARADGGVEARAGETDLFLRPGARFRAVDALVTNFHLPRSSLLLLVAAFAGQPPGEASGGRALVLRAYREALAAGYRFYSYGDATLLL
jgi:S-adenosylmethionine:tRNA ribosyltransferase-isomerase